MGTLANQAEIGARVQEQGALAGFRGYNPRKKILRFFMQNPAKQYIFARKWYAILSIMPS